MRMVCRNDGRVISQSYVWRALAVSCRMREIGGVGTVQLVYIGGLLRMGSESSLMPVWRFVRDGFNGKGESDVWVARACT